ncbi:unnamed protein product [Penicillium pancosmium]
MPLKTLSDRNMWSNLLYAFIANLANFQILFFLPIYFQAVHDMSAIKSGVNCLPFMAFYTCPIEFGSGLIAVLGATLIYCIDVKTSKAWYIGARIPFGLGIGLGNQVPVTALQGFATPETVAATMGIAFMAQCISGAYFVSAANSIFGNYLLRTLARTAPQIDSSDILYLGVSELTKYYEGEQLALIRDAYMVGIKDVFAFALAGTVLTVFMAILIPLKRLPSHETKEVEDKDAAAKQRTRRG